MRINMLFRRFASILLCAVMLLNIVPASTFAENDSGAALVSTSSGSSTVDREPDEELLLVGAINDVR